MDATTVGIDLAKDVFEIALADERGHIVERQRLSRARLPIKSVDQQALQQLHRLRSQWMGARNSRLSFLRGCLREFGIVLGPKRAIDAVRAALADASCPVPSLLHASLIELLEEIGTLEQRCKQLDRELKHLHQHEHLLGS